MEEDTQVEQPPLFSKKKFTPKFSKKPPPVIENPQSNESLEVEKSCDPDSYTLSFSDLGLADWAIQTCKELGMKKPTQVQHHCIPRIIAGQDVLGLAQTGTGKTAAFALPILNRLAENPYGVYALVITPTRELAYQLAEQFRALGACLHLRCAVVVGGMDMITQAQALMQRPHVVIATPGRIKVLLEHNPDIPAVFSKTKFLVLDEADRVLDVGFEEELSEIFQYLPNDRQTLLFSATMTDNLQTLLEVSANKAYFYEQYEGFKTVESLKQQYIFVPKNVKDVYLLHVLSKMEDMGIRSAIIFVSTCRSCHLLSLLLEELEQPAVGLHSHKSQALRLSALHCFKSGQTPILLATDVASRGLDIPTVDLVINYDIPRYARDYVHRVGRTARAGRGGLAVSFVTQNDVDLIHEIETVVGKQLDKFECKENDVLAEISKVYKARRVATMKMIDDGFEQKAEDRKAQKLKTLSEKGLLKEKTKNRRRAKTTSVEYSKSDSSGLLKYITTDFGFLIFWILDTIDGSDCVGKFFDGITRRLMICFKEYDKHEVLDCSLERKQYAGSVSFIGGGFAGMSVPLALHDASIQLAAYRYMVWMCRGKDKQPWSTISIIMLILSLLFIVFHSLA